jgi:spore germination cell wall hydrolase CwlJ-like protein
VRRNESPRSVSRKPNRIPLSPLVLGFALWLGFPTVAAYQDMASLVAGETSAKARWGAYVEAAGAGTVQEVNMPFVDKGITGSVGTGSIAGGGISVPGLGRVALAAARGAAIAIPDEERINRAAKRGRVVSVAPVAPPDKFNAGSVVRRTSALIRPQKANPLTMAFLAPDIQGEEIVIATAFHMRKRQKPVEGVSGMLAGLVNNPRPDILATAYAPAGPDYARASPFASVLREEAEQRGRFIPPASEEDHAWLKRPLPPGVFTESEQRCLTAGVYFEARGEPVAGQAAVAQVILNRVRNPTYPNTVCGVVYQNKSWRNRCQFSFACDGIRDRVASKEHWDIAQEVAQAVTAGLIWFPEVGSSTHYHATYVNPRWAHRMERMKKIGQHIFYRTYGGGWN